MTETAAAPPNTPSPASSATSSAPGAGSVYLHHVSFRVDDLDRSLDFYTTLLGCTQLPRPEMGFRGAWLQLGDIQIHLLEVARAAEHGQAPAAALNTANHTAFHVDDFERFRAYLIERGYEPAMGRLSSLTQLFVQDPDGNVIEFTPAAR